MGFMFESGFGDVICVLLVFLWCFYKYITKNYNYWQQRGIPYAAATFPFGTLPSVALGLMHMGEGHDCCYKKFKKERFFGIIQGRKPVLVINDLDLVKQVLIKDFHHFSDRVPLPKAVQSKEYIANHLFNMANPEWRDMRLTLTPTFTSGKMKIMFSLFEKCSEQLDNYMKKQVETSSVVDVKETLSRFTMDIIASCAFGLDMNTLDVDRNCSFYQIAIDIFRTTKLRILRRLWFDILPFLSKIYIPRIVSLQTTEFFTNIIRDTVNYREKNGIVRNDFLDLLIKIRQSKGIQDDQDKCNYETVTTNTPSSVKKDLTIEEITAQSFLFFIAGFETSSSTAAFCLYELARHPNVQEKVYKELEYVSIKNGGKVTYQALQEMTYMEQVINETLRLYASVAILSRTCTESYKIPDSDVIIEKGARITIPAYSIHHDPEYYPQPYSFDPERFSAENIKERHPCLHMPFGEGPRMCIGMRFGLMQTKVALATMLHTYEFSLASEDPVTIHKAAFVTLPAKPLLLHARRRNVY